MSENKKDKNLSEKDVEKVSGGCCNPGGCLPEDPFERRRRKKNKPNWEKILKDLKPNLKDKSLNEKEIEKVSGGCCDPRGCNPINYKHPWKRKPYARPAIRYGGICKLDFEKLKEKEKSNSEFKNINSLINSSKDLDK